MKALFKRIVVFFLTLEARAVLKKYAPQIIVVTGSVGKTSSKDAVYAALARHTFVRKSEKSYNSDVGVPLTILGVPNGWNDALQWLKNLLDGLLLILIIAPYPRWLVIEVGADRPGDISESLAWLTPQVVITTRFPDVPVHVEFYDSPAAVIKEELFPLTRLAPGGVAVINVDDTHAASVLLKESVRRLGYGFSKDADVRASRYRILSNKGLPDGVSFDVRYRSESAHLSLRGVVGYTHIYAVCAGIAGALAAGAPFSKATTVGDAYEGSSGRLRLLPGIADAALIDDSYNASPVATTEALHALKDAPTKGRRIAVLGDMLELGSFSSEEHKKIGAVARECADILVTVGIRARYIADGARAGGMPPASVHAFEKGSDASTFLLSTIGAGDVVLIKGSQSMRMERIVKALMARPEEAAALIPRQDPEWLSRA